MIQSFSAERHSERTITQMVVTSVPQIQEQIVEVAEILPQERTPEHTVEPLVGVPVPQIQEQILEVAEILPQGRTSEHTVGVAAPQILEEIVEVVPQERISARICEQIADMPVPQILERAVEVVKAGPAVKFVPQDHIPRGFVNRSLTPPFHMPWTSSLFSVRWKS